MQTFGGEYNSTEQGVIPIRPMHLPFNSCPFMVSDCMVPV